MPRFDQSFNGLCEQNLQDTLQLKQRYLDQKTKRPAKPKDKKQQDTIQSSVHVQQKFLKRSAEDHDPGGGGQDNSSSFEPPVKLQCTTQHGSHQPEGGLTKFSVEIVQQLEFTTSAANSQPQQISTNVTVKAHTNASVKSSDVASPKPSNPSTPGNNKNQLSMGVGNVDVSNLVECVKQEPNNDFADLEECAAAVEKDAANGGMGFGGITDLIGDDTNDEIFTSPAFKDLISDISSYPEFNFDFEDKHEVDLKVEDLKDIPMVGDPKVGSGNTHNSPLVQQQQGQNYSPPVFENKGRMPPYSNMDFTKTELSPAAQTLKQMAEQHQHKNQMGLSFNPGGGRAPNSRSPYPDFQLADYGSPNPPNPGNYKSSPSFPQADMIKQEMIFQGSDYDLKRKGGLYKQQYSPYGSPSPGSHGSPGYLPRSSNTGTNNGTSNASNASYSGATPPRPPSGPGGGNNNSNNNNTGNNNSNNSNGTTLQINQAQSMHISHGHNIQVSAGQHLHLSGDLKGNVSIATQQGLHFQQQHQNQHQNQHQQQQQAQHQQAQHQQTQHQQAQHQQQQQQPQHQNQNPSASGNPQNSAQNNGPQQGNQQSNASASNPSNNNAPGNQQSNQQQHPSASLLSDGGHGGPMQQPNNIPGMPNSSHQNPNMQANSGPMGPGGMMAGMNQHHGMGGSQHLGPQSQLGDSSYSMTQSQTINFTQQSLRQRNGGGMGPMGGTGQMGGGPMGPSMRHMSPMDQQKLVQQQQMLRAQQQAMQQQQQPMLLRPPPPDYKTTAGMMQGMGPRYGGPGVVPPTNIRRIPHQQMPPSGPMMRPHNMYMMQQQQQQQQQQQHMTSRSMYPRQQAPPPQPTMDSMPQHGSAEWRHMMMAQQQQQSNSFNAQMRPNFHNQGFNMNSAGMQMQSMQQQQPQPPPQMRNQHVGMSGGMVQGQMMGQQGGPMAQMNSMNQQMMMQQQQQQTVVQQANTQMSMTNIHMQQSQSLSVSSNQAMHQQQHHISQQQQPMGNQQLVSAANNSASNNELFDMLGIQGDSGLTEQELLNTFASDSFNLNDIGF